jgi:hypothetical protein
LFREVKNYYRQNKIDYSSVWMSCNYRWVKGIWTLYYRAVCENVNRSRRFQFDFNKQKQPPGRLAIWLTYLQSFLFQVEHRLGSKFLMRTLLVDNYKSLILIQLLKTIAKKKLALIMIFLKTLHSLLFAMKYMIFSAINY